MSPSRPFGGLPEPQLYPTADSWAPPALPGNAELDAYREELEAWPKKTLVKRFILVRNRTMDAISKPELLEETRYSLSCIPLTPWSRCSGSGDDRGWLVWVYYMPDDEPRVLASFQALGVRLADRERMAVDPDSPDEDEQIMMAFPQQTHHVSAWEHEVLLEGEEPRKQPASEYCR
mmetsp:Transcript_17010/g.49362  ORF Transcript_17010/g.49362 Transcript_17010/m.49362 type:complete len:176 (-) Transcript_17010:27-554(-)